MGRQWRVLALFVAMSCARASERPGGETKLGTPAQGGADGSEGRVGYLRPAPLAEPPPGAGLPGFGPGAPLRCPETRGDATVRDEDGACAVSERVRCSETCEGFSASLYVRVDRGWELVKREPPICRCAPAQHHPELEVCSLVTVVTEPGDHSRDEQCRAEFRCGGRDLFVECDDENDGTDTSLCSCSSRRDGRGMTGSGVHPGRGGEVCFAGAAACLRQAGPGAPSSSRNAERHERATRRTAGRWGDDGAAGSPPD